MIVTEFWDAYDRNLNKIGLTLIRGKDVPDGVYHIVCDVLVKHEDGTYLLMQRSPEKNFPGMWEATAGGSALKGEIPQECVQRELFEETGLVCNIFSKVGCIISDHNHAIYIEYVCESDWDKSAVILQKGETSDFRWVTLKELKNLKKDELITTRMQKFVKEISS